MMDEILDQIDQLVIDKYNELKKDCKTFRDLNRKICDFKTSLAWSRNSRNCEFYSFIAGELFKLYDKEVNEKTID